MVIRMARQNFKSCLVLLLLVQLSGCMMMPPATIIHQPITQRPNLPVKPVETNGSIFQSTGNSSAGNRYIPLFEDRRARSVGDTIIVTLNERTNASKQSGSNVNRTGAIDFSATGFLGLSLGDLQKASINAETGNTFDGSGASSSNNDFTGTITVTVIEVLPNGNLLVSGEKQIGINQGHEFIRLSGIVNPINIIGNTISSVQVADARIEYRAKGYIDEAQTMGWFSRLLMSISPF